MSDEHQGLQTHLPSFPHLQNVPQMPPPQPLHQHQMPSQQLPAQANPVLQQAFVAWLQYMQLQMQLQQQQQQPHQQAPHLPPQQTQHQPQHAQSSNAPFAHASYSSLPPIETSMSFQRETLSPEQPTGQPTETPSPTSGNEGLDPDTAATALAEEKRRRNTAASGEQAVCAFVFGELTRGRSKRASE